MLEAWTLHPWFFAFVSAAGIVLLSLLGIWENKTRNIRHQERLACIQKGTPLVYTFSERLIRSVPWPFWASLLILAVLIVFVFISSKLGLTETAKSATELVKYVTGATMAALFGSGSNKTESTRNSTTG